MIGDRIAEVLQQRFEEEDLKTCFLVNVEASKNNKVSVFIDADDGLTIDMCKKVSRYLENQIEEHGWLPDKYTLDVSSPGIDNPLRLHRQYVKNIGRNARIKLTDGREQEGTISDVADEYLNLRGEDGKEEHIEFKDIYETKILVSFKRKK